MTADTVGGVWTYTMELCAGLKRHGTEVALATMGAPLAPDQRAEAARLDNLEVYESNFKLEWMEDPWTDVAKAGEWLLEIESRLRPDIVHLNGYAHAALEWRAPVIVVGHSCVLSWWDAVKGEPAPAQWDRYRAEVRRGLEAADAVVCPSAAMLAALQRWYGIGSGTVIPNGRDAGEFRPGPKKDYVFSAGRLWDEAKNVSAVAQAAAGLPWPVYVAGETRSPDGRGAELENVRFLGRLTPPRIREWYAGAAIYALPARYEPFGLSVLEAALSGCALVLGDIPSLRENWEGAAILVDPNDSAALRREITDLIASPGRRSAFQVLARKRGLEFTPERMAQAYLELYQGTRKLCAS